MAETAPPLPREKRSRRHRKAEASSPSPTPAVPLQNRLTLRQRIKRDRVMLLLTLPGLLYFIVFHYVPLLGYVVAFQDYQPYLGYMHSVWVGFANFTTAFGEPAFWSATFNTLEIAVIQLVFFFPVPVALALLLNSIASDRIRRFVQSVVYLPHFIGWVIIVSIFQQILGGAGLLPDVLGGMGLPRYDMMSDPEAFPWLLTLQVAWKDAGWGTIIILAALLGIDKGQYEAAAIDGAGPRRRLWHVTLPGIAPVLILLLILNLGQILSVGFEQILLQRDAVGPDAGEVLDTYVYYHGIKDNDWGVAAAVGLVKAVIGTALVLGANKFAHRLGHEGVYRGADR
ncbi:ABC transporter permease subunit [Streptomyces sp. NBC_00121]|uniref:ABC transporter permease n=1 Tax=unclassified Streptomyces TaxID=2593676 RepID=UPI002DD83668|nr:ABC transporter permease subunit [Streptomyces sp. NBC_01760]WSC73024.1 ABC transporter permease subunit [Streptomyces sp. NBC_01760]WTI90752.1 ABC transporter permease subunit [Streptomyces sp. NBC_00724]